MAKIFLSYRRSDTQGITGRIYDRFTDRFGANSVFMDVDSIPPGVDFRQQLTEWIQSSDILVVVVGNHWFDRGEPGRNALDDPADFVRIELQAALERNIPVVPLLVDGAPMPSADHLPDELQNFAYRNAISISSGRDFTEQLNRLFQDMEGLLGLTTPDEVSKNGTADAESTSGILNVEMRNPPRRNLSSALGISLIICVISGCIGFWIGTRDTRFYISPDEVTGLHSALTKIESRSTPELEALWRGLDGPTRSAIEEYLENGAEGDERVQNRVRGNLNRLLSSGQFILGNDAEGWSDQTVSLAGQFRNSGDKARVNRLTLEKLFPDELQRWIPGLKVGSTLARIQKNIEHTENGLTGAVVRLLLTVLISLIIIVISAYYIALGSLEITFKDRGAVDTFLNEFILQMGFKPPIEQGKELIYKATLSTILIYSVLTLRVVITDNRMLVTGPLPLIRRLRKRLSVTA